MKSLDNGLLRVVRGIIKDIHAAYPDMQGLERDFERLALCFKTRGEGLFTLDLPHLDSLLIEGLETGHLSLHGPLSHVVSKKVHVPRLFAGLWRRVFSDIGCLLPEPDVDCILFLRQLCCLGKKLNRECSVKRRMQTIEDYFNVDSSLPEPTLRWSEDDAGPDLDLHTIHVRDCMDPDIPILSELEEWERDRLWENIQLSADYISKSLGTFCPIDYPRERAEEGRRGTGFKHGPGAVATGNGRFDKYLFTNWPKRLEFMFPYALCGKPHQEYRGSLSSKSIPSRLISVQKTAKSPRLIAAEPVENQWCQQLMLSYFVDRIRQSDLKHFINFTRQDLSGAMALMSSEDGKLATIDLSSASDRLSCWLVERIFRSNPSILYSLHACRTPVIQYQQDNHSKVLRMKKFASQGTAVTFPVQTLVFLAIAIGACIDGWWSEDKFLAMRNRVRIFGDDIIIPNRGYARVTSALESLFLKVNDSKSFHQGKFRESCGTDAYMGYDITPVRISDYTPDGPTKRRSILDASNNLFYKGFWHAAEEVLNLLPSYVIRNTGVCGPLSGYPGLGSFCGDDLSHLQVRWNSNLHRTEYRGWILKNTVMITDPGSDSSMLRYFTEDPSLLSVTDYSPGFVESSKSKDGLGWWVPYLIR